MDKYNQTLPDTWHGTSQGIDRSHFFQDPGKMILGKIEKMGVPFMFYKYISRIVSSFISSPPIQLFSENSHVIRWGLQFITFTFHDTKFKVQ